MFNLNRYRVSQRLRSRKCNVCHRNTYERIFCIEHTDDYLICEDCGQECDLCPNWVCSEHARICCDEIYCVGCADQELEICEECGKDICPEHTVEINGFLCQRCAAQPNPEPYHSKNVAHGACLRCFAEQIGRVMPPGEIERRKKQQVTRLLRSPHTVYCSYCKKLLYDAETGIIYEKNPLIPKIPSAPPWDPSATASGVYVTDSKSIARSYAEAAADQDNSVPLVIAIDITGLDLKIDPQAIDLLQEPFQDYREIALTQIRSAYENLLKDKTFELWGDVYETRAEARKAARRQLPTVAEFAAKYIADPIIFWGSAAPNYPSQPKVAKQKREVAQVIFPEDHTWMLIRSIHDFYGENAPEVIQNYLKIQIDDEISPYSLHSIYISPRHQFTFEPEFWFYLSNFAYLVQTVPDDRIIAIWTVEDEWNLVHKKTISAKKIAYHGTSSARVKDALANLLPKSLHE